MAETKGRRGRERFYLIYLLLPLDREEDMLFLPCEPEDCIASPTNMLSVGTVVG